MALGKQVLTDDRKQAVDQMTVQQPAYVVIYHPYCSLGILMEQTLLPQLLLTSFLSVSTAVNA